MLTVLFERNLFSQEETKSRLKRIAIIQLNFNMLLCSQEQLLCLSKQNFKIQKTFVSRNFNAIYFVLVSLFFISREQILQKPRLDSAQFLHIYLQSRASLFRKHLFISLFPLCNFTAIYLAFHRLFVRRKEQILQKSKE